MTHPLPYRDELPMNAAPSRCELCGAILTSEGPDSEPYRDAQALVQVALMLEDDLVGTVALLLRSLRGHTYAAIGSKFLIGHALSRQAIHQRISKLAHRYPGVAGILTDNK